MYIAGLISQLFSLLIAEKALLDVAASAFAVMGVMQSFPLMRRAYLLFQAHKETEEKAFHKALTSDNLEVVGKYLGDKLGAVDLGTYVRDATIRNRVDTYVEKLARFLDAPLDKLVPASQSNKAKRPGKKTSRQRKPPAGQYPEVIRKAVDDLERGEIWNALARLRRDLEKQLRAKIPNAPRSLSLRQLIELISPKMEKDNILRPTRKFLHIANAAIHGEDIDIDDARLAIEYARQIYEWLNEWLDQKK
jgi:HEPN domain-containing protein